VRNVKLSVETRVVEDRAEQLRCLLQMDDCAPEADNVLIEVEYPAELFPMMGALAEELRACYGDMVPPKSLLLLFHEIEGRGGLLHILIPKYAWDAKPFNMTVIAPQPETAEKVRELYGHLLDAEPVESYEAAGAEDDGVALGDAGPPKPVLWDPKKAVAGAWVLVDEKPGKKRMEVCRIDESSDHAGEWEVMIGGNFYSKETGRRTWEGETGRAYTLAAPIGQEETPATWDPEKAVPGAWVLVHGLARPLDPFLAQIEIDPTTLIVVSGRWYYPATGESFSNPGARLYMLDLKE